MFRRLAAGQQALGVIVRSYLHEERKCKALTEPSQPILSHHINPLCMSAAFPPKVSFLMQIAPLLVPLLNFSTFSPEDMKSCISKMKLGLTCLRTPTHRT